MFFVQQEASSLFVWVDQQTWCDTDASNPVFVHPNQQN